MADQVRVSALEDFEPGDIKRVEVGDEHAVVVRIDDDFYAIGDRCSHANYSLSEGELDCDEKTITCWKHGAEFSLCDGVPQTLPATQPVPVFAIRVADGDVFLSSQQGDA